ncbi:MAG: hypothetical protein M1825_004471 [Sarcosagium campestre]|nr:MAG: hypothetical protein M1825_004471 [Sarcosagium campestre]
MGAEAPFLYDPPSRYSASYSEFNPKSVTQASLQPVQPRPKQEGPLVNFNKHPDSYLILPYGNRNATPMSPRTKTKVKVTRFVQLALRCLLFLGAIGLLLCSICIRKVESASGWILRVPPGVSIIHNVYGIYHLARGASGRTPASSASYMLFASALDAGLVPFFVFAALMAKTQYDLEDKAEWTTVFDDSVANRKIVYAALLLGITAAALHAAALLISLYLAVLFRKISKLPPDMNPLEDNLTSRHKKKISSISMPISDKRFSQGSTASELSDANATSQRNSRVHDPLMATHSRSMPFLQTRNNDSSASLAHYYTPPTSARNSRADLPSQLSSSRHSRADLSRSSRTPSPTKQRNSHLSLDDTPPKSSTADSPSSVYRRDSLINDNWFSYEDIKPSEADDGMSPTRELSTVSSLRSHEARLASSGPAYHALNTSHDITEVPSRQPPTSFAQVPVPRPLESHPPTPPPQSQSPQISSQPRRKTPLTTTTPNRIGSLKAKLYGDLKPATPPLMVGKFGELAPPPSSVGSSNNGSPGRGSGRVLSNSSNDYGFEPRGGRKRDVSGKVAEEGRGGWTRLRRDSFGEVH